MQYHIVGCFLSYFLPFFHVPLLAQGDESPLATRLPDTEDWEQQQQQQQEAASKPNPLPPADFVADNDTSMEREMLVQTTIEAERRESEGSGSN
jgi:hypothetical protein